MVEWFLLSGSYRVSSLTNNGVFCGEFGEVGSFLDPGSSLFRSEGLWNESRVYEVKVLLDGRRGQEQKVAREVLEVV